MSNNTNTEATTTVEVDEATIEVPTLEELGQKHARFQEQAAEKVVNPIVLAELIGVRPQMIYNYIRAGKIETVSHNNTQKKTIALEEAQRFAQAYLLRKGLKAAKIQAELEGEAVDAE